MAIAGGVSANRGCNFPSESPDRRSSENVLFKCSSDRNCTFRAWFAGQAPQLKILVLVCVMSLRPFRWIQRFLSPQPRMIERRLFMSRNTIYNISLWTLPEKNFRTKYKRSATIGLDFLSEIPEWFWQQACWSSWDDLWSFSSSVTLRRAGKSGRSGWSCRFRAAGRDKQRRQIAQRRQEEKWLGKMMMMGSWKPFLR